MNDKFYDLPVEKQERIINAGFKVFSRNSYRKSPVGQIASEAGVSKSLLFFYFRNKKELYLFLWKKVEEIVTEALKSREPGKEADIFDMMYDSLSFKIGIIRDHPDIFNFALKVYYEDDPEVRDEIRMVVNPYTSLDTNVMLKKLDPNDFKDGTDLSMMYQDVYLASEGYLWRMSQEKEPDIDKLLADFRRMTDFWKTTYLKRHESGGTR